MRSGDRPGLQNRRVAGNPVTGGFDPHSLPPFFNNLTESRESKKSKSGVDFGHHGASHAVSGTPVLVGRVSISVFDYTALSDLLTFDPAPGDRPHFVRRTITAAVGWFTDFIGFQVAPSPLGGSRATTGAEQYPSGQAVICEGHQIRPVVVGAGTRQISSAAFRALNAMTNTLHSDFKAQVG